ncbi:MAG TPA: hypothetical protein VF757_03090 [Sphingomicrobium sp.]
MLIARASATAIAAALALSPTYAAAPKPIVDLSKSPALTGKAEAAAPAKTAPRTNRIGPVDEQTAELGGGAVVLLALGAGAFAISRSRRRRREEAEWDEATETEVHDPLFDEPMFQHEPATEHQAATTEASAFAWGNEQPCDNPADDGSDRCPGESWVERAYRGPSPANPSVSLKARLKRAAFFDKRERDVAAGRAAPVETDAGLPETMVEEQERELA